MPYGFLDTRFIDLPAGIDEAYLRGLRTRAGVDFPAILRMLDQRLGALNTTLDPLVASLIYPTTDVMAESTPPVAFQIDERGEYTLARPQLADVGATMLPIRGYDVSMGFTEDGLELMSLSRIEVQVDSVLLGWRRLYRRKAFERLFSDLEMRVDIRTAATSPGFAGSGTGSNVFTPTTYPDGTAIPGGYTHYYRIAAAALAAGLLTVVQQIRKWNPPPYDLAAPQAMLDLITAINPGNPTNGFVSAGSALVRQGTGLSEAMVDSATYLGVLFGDVRVHMAITDFSSPDIAIYKSYGNLDSRNPLAWRYDAVKGRAATVRSRSLYPLDQSVVRQDFGLGVNNRTAAALITVADSGAYTPPTFN